MGDHTEAISIDYDPEVVSYDDLLDIFWKAHRCESSNTSQQYMNAVFYRDDSQRTAAEKSLTEQAAQRQIKKSAVQTKILPTKTFTYAEAYHQKYYLTRYSDIRAFLSKTYPDGKSLADSTVATRLNAYLGSGMKLNWSEFIKELPSYGLPENIVSQLKKGAERKTSTQ